MTMFPALPFETLNESDVREEVITPLLRALGYRSGTANNIIREQALRYPRVFLGRKDLRKDPELRGRADYILEVQQTVRWVVEAKAPAASIDIDVVEQAWTYANHPEVRAVYFTLCNGPMTEIYQTNHGPQAKPILTIPYGDLEAQLGRIADVLGPQALLRDFPKKDVAPLDPIGPGLRPVVRIANGLIQYDRNSLGSPALNELQSSIAEGAVERDENGCLVAWLRTVAPMRSFQELNERLGLTSFEMLSSDRYLSIDPQKPTTFENRQTVTLPAGEKIFDISRGQYMTLQTNLICDTETRAQGVLHGLVFTGRFWSQLRYQNLGATIVLEGRFEIHLA